LSAPSEALCECRGGGGGGASVGGKGRPGSGGQERVSRIILSKGDVAKRTRSAGLGFSFGKAIPDRKGIGGKGEFAEPYAHKRVCKSAIVLFGNERWVRHRRAEKRRTALNRGGEEKMGKGGMRENFR